MPSSPARPVTTAQRLQPGDTHDFAGGLRAQIADPLWFLTRQWQLGEHQGFDGGIPVEVTFSVSHAPVQVHGSTRAGRSAPQPDTVPAEAFVEAEPDAWWTTGRRIRFSRAVERALEGARPGLSALVFDQVERLGPQPEPYARFADVPDGLQVYRRVTTLIGAPMNWEHRPPHGPSPILRPDQRRSLAAALGGVLATVPIPLVGEDSWDPATLRHEYNGFVTDHGTMPVRGHAGGPIDWYSVDLPAAWLPPAQRETRQALPTAARFPAAPDPRWWTIEDQAVDLGGYPPLPHQLGALTLIDIVSRFGSDWFTFEVLPPAGPGGTHPVGDLVLLHEATVRDSFDEVHAFAPEESNGAIFRYQQGTPTPVLRWPTVGAKLQADSPTDEAVLVVDQVTNAVWARQLRKRGLPVDPPAAQDGAAQPDLPVAIVETRGMPSFRYEPMLLRGDQWFLYTVDPDPDVSEGNGIRLHRHPVVAPGGPEPVAGQLLGEHLDPRSVPWQGLHLQRRYVLARGTDARPVLWAERRSEPLINAPSVLLRFDVVSRIEGP